MDTTLKALIETFNAQEVIRIDNGSNNMGAYWMIWDEDTFKEYGNIPMHKVNPDELAYKNKWHDEMFMKDTIEDITDSLMMSHELKPQQPYEMTDYLQVIGYWKV
ncbi:MAG: hypothetical protein HQK93_07800 [Nitrospirae bacterium]|nr:hypothetical protein [Nitrospirota bacterium]